MGGSVALTGFASATREGVYQSKADEIWSLNMLHSSTTMRKIFPLNITRLFELHPAWMLKAPWYTSGDHWGWLTKVKHHYPVYMIESYPEVHNAIRYPLEAVCERFLSHFRRGDEQLRYFTSSMCYMIALAAFEGFERIEVYGFEMGSDTEYIYQKSGAEFWLGVAGQYSDVILTPESRLLKSKLYGFEGGQLVTAEMLEEYRSYYEAMIDGALLPPITTEKWIQGNLITGAVTLIDEIVAQGSAISRQVLEGYKEKFGAAARKLNFEINALNAQSWDREEEKKEPLFEDAFERYKYMFRYDGGWQLAAKLIEELDLQSPGKELENRYKFHQFSVVKKGEEQGQDGRVQAAQGA